VVVDDRPDNCLDVVLESKAGALLVWRGGEATVPASARRLGIAVVPTVARVLEALVDADRVDGQGSLLDRLRAMFGLSPAEFEVIVTDIGLPDASGWDLIPQAREKRPTLRIGVVNGWEGHNAPTEGADFMLRKPIRTSDFLSQVAGDT